MGAGGKSAKNSPFPSSFPGVGDVTGESELLKACFSLCHRLWLGEEFEPSLQCWAGLPILIEVFGFATELLWCHPAGHFIPILRVPVGLVFCYVDFSPLFVCLGFSWVRGGHRGWRCILLKNTSKTHSPLEGVMIKQS